MTTSTLSVLLVVLAASESTPFGKTQHQKEMEDHHAHLQYINTYSCHYPQRKTISVKELLPLDTRGKSFFPDVTVLHRCDTVARCCREPETNVPLDAREVILPFLVTYLADFDNNHKGNPSYEYYGFVNHTVCGCGHVPPAPAYYATSIPIPSIPYAPPPSSPLARPVY